MKGNGDSGWEKGEEGRRGAEGARHTPFFSAVAVQGVVVGRAQIPRSIETVGDNLESCA